MPTDIKLDQGGDGNWLLAEGNVLKTTAADFMLDSPSRRRPGGGPHRRALVHDTNDGLTINFAGDYPGGVTVTGNLTVAGEIRLAAGNAVGAAIESLQSTIDDLRRSASGSSFRLDTLERTVASLVILADASVIPAWSTRQEVEEGDDMGIVSPSAAELGLAVEFTFERLNPNFAHEDVIRITPEPGTAVRRGSTVVVLLNLEG